MSSSLRTQAEGFVIEPLVCLLFLIVCRIGRSVILRRRKTQRPQYIAAIITYNQWGVKRMPRFHEGIFLKIPKKEG